MHTFSSYLTRISLLNSSSARTSRALMILFFTNSAVFRRIKFQAFVQSWDQEEQIMTSNIFFIRHGCHFLSTNLIVPTASIVDLFPIQILAGFEIFIKWCKPMLFLCVMWSVAPERTTIYESPSNSAVQAYFDCTFLSSPIPPRGATAIVFPAVLITRAHLFFLFGLIFPPCILRC